MKIGALLLSAALLVVAHVTLGSASPSTVPAFLWSPHLRSLNSELDEAVNYQVVLPKDLASSVLSKGGWSNFLCSGKDHEQPIDLALVVIGRELRSSDVSENANPSLVDMLKDSFTRSNFSVAFPYVVAPEGERMESLLVSGFVEACGHTLGVSNIVFSEACSVEDGSTQKLADLQSLRDHLLTRKEARKEGEADLVVYCTGADHFSKELDETHEESDIFSELISSVEQSGARYSALYVSDPYRFTSHQLLQRLLAESAPRNGSANFTGCNEVCQIKSSLLEGVLVGIVLLLILISGLCCMAGIDTPTRFETPQDS